MPQLTPTPKFRAVGADGLALVGGKLWTYIEGTSTPKATYTSFTLGASNTNPVILDARGEADVWLDGSYKLVLTDAADVTIWTVDSIRDLTQNQTFTGATLAGTLTVSSTSVTWSGNPTHSGNHTFSGNVTVQGNTQLGNASSDTLRIDPNAVTWTNNPTHSGNHTFSGNVTVNGNTTIGDAAGDTLTVAPSAVTWSNNPTHSGNHTFSGNVTAANLLFNKYTPTITSVANVASTTAFQCLYTRVGASVTVYGLVSVDPTATATLTKVGISLPVASNLGTCYGVAAALGSDVYFQGAITADTTNDRAELQFFALTSALAQAFTFNFMYEVV